MIEIKNISKSFNDKQVLFDISGKFTKGRTNLIIGASGTGKSVLLKCMVGLLNPDTGKVLFDDRDFTSGNKQLLTEIRRDIGMLFQAGALFDSKNVEENIKFPLDILSNLTENDKIEKVNHCLKLVGLENINKKMPSEISGGMKKRVGIARAIAVRPKYILYDEPTTGLDPIMTDSINKLISKLHTLENVTSIIVTHEMRTVYDVTDRVLMLDEGKIRFNGSSDEIKESDDLIVRNFIEGVSDKEFHKN